MELIKVNKIPSKTCVRQYEIIQLINDFKKSKNSYVEVVLNEAEPLVRTYNSIYQACKRTTGVNVRRVSNKIYLIKVNSKGEEV